MLLLLLLLLLFTQIKCSCNAQSTRHEARGKDKPCHNCLSSSPRNAQIELRLKSAKTDRETSIEEKRERDERWASVGSEYICK